MTPAPAKCCVGRPAAANSGCAKPYGWPPPSLYADKSYLGEKFRRLRARMGAPKAITAMAHQYARIIWHLLTYHEAFELSVFAAQEEAHARRQLRRLAASARHLGYQLTPMAAA